MYLPLEPKKKIIMHTQAISSHKFFAPRVVPAKSVIDISVASLLASIKIIFIETAIPFFLWSFIQFLTYSSSFGLWGAHERKVFFYTYLLWLNLSLLPLFSYHLLCWRWAKTPFSCLVTMFLSIIHDFNFKCSTVSVRVCGT